MPRTKLETLGQLHATKHRLAGYCSHCEQPFNIDLAQLVQKRGASRRIVGMEPIPCPECHLSKTEFRILPPVGADKEAGGY